MTRGSHTAKNPAAAPPTPLCHVVSRRLEVASPTRGSADRNRVGEVHVCGVDECRRQQGHRESKVGDEDRRGVQYTGMLGYIVEDELRDRQGERTPQEARRSRIAGRLQRRNSARAREAAATTRPARCRTQRQERRNEGSAIQAGRRSCRAATR